MSSDGAATTPTTISVGDAHDVVVGHDIIDRLPQLVGDDVSRVLVVHAYPVTTVADGVAAALTEALPSRTVLTVAVPDAEEAKTIEVAAELWSRLGQADFTRSDVVVAVGGGTVTDLAGFVAATWLRGIRVVHVPTTLLGMVDAAVGGKTGVNTAEGKNLVGAFHTPTGVLCDLDLLATLPTADVRSGMAEIVKSGFIADPTILDLIEADPAAAMEVRGPVLRELVERTIRVKAEVVSRDLTESWLREILNYGHTLGHAVEQVEGFTIRHGEAVSIGMVYAAELARITGHLDRDDVARHRTVLEGLGLPVRYRGDRWAGLREAMGRDKKARGDRLRFVVLGGIGHPIRLEGPSEWDLRTAYATISAEPAPPER